MYMKNKFSTSPLRSTRNITPTRQTTLKSTMKTTSPLKNIQNNQNNLSNIDLNSHKKQIQQTKSQLKTKQTIGILYSLQQIYQMLNFNQFDAFSQQRIIQARKNIQKMCVYFKQQPRCYRHEDLLNLYCQNCKQVICVSCVYKGNQQHKNHKIRSLDNVMKSIQLQTIRSQEKVKGFRGNLSIRQDQILQIQKQISQNFMNVSSNSINIINDTIKQLQNMKQQYDNKLTIAYKRTGTIVKRYNDCLQSMISMLDSNIQKASTLKGLGKYLLLKQVGKYHQLMDDLISKFNQNKTLMQQWKKAMKQTQKVIVKNKKQKIRREDVYTVTQF